MQNKNAEFTFTTGVVGYPMLFVLLIWIVFWFEIRSGINLNDFGIYPRTVRGLQGIFFSPFIHADMSHLWNNTLPLAILSAALFFFYSKNAWKILLIGVCVTGFCTWIFGRPAMHIGASGVIYMLFGFLFFKGIFAKHYRLIALSFVVVFIYGSMVMYVLPVDPNISWESHLSGISTGMVLAFFIKKGVAKPKQYIWETEEYNPNDDEFLQHFDENGNFIENKQLLDSDIDIVYEYKERNSNNRMPEEE